MASVKLVHPESGLVRVTSENTMSGYLELGFVLASEEDNQVDESSSATEADSEAAEWSEE